MAKAPLRSTDADQDITVQPPARDRDKLRQMILESLGWKLHRIWSTDWWHDANQEIEKLLRSLKGLSNV